MENESKTENKNQVARLLEKHGDRVFRTAFMYLKNYQDAEDVLQMTFEKYLIAKPLFKSEEHEKAWFLRVAINISKNLVTSGWKKKVIYDDEQLKLFADEAVAQVGISDSDDNSEAVLKAVLALPKKLSVQLFYYEEYSVAQIADLLDISVGNVTTRLNRARKKLEKSLREV
jgi:RNA polymerase sigma factor (sigma-70 family)